METFKFPFTYSSKIEIYDYNIMWIAKYYKMNGEYYEKQKKKWN